jgi:predicted enzyme related to lactoylglutathione lyase
MKKIILLSGIILTSFAFGFALNNILTNKPADDSTHGKVTGIGGIFFKCRHPDKMREWYGKHLGLIINPYGSVFEWRQAGDSSKKGFTQWSAFSDSTKYFGSSGQDFMINYRVDNLESLVENLRNDGVTIADKIETVDYGKFVHVVDGEGNKIELWEPNDVEYEKLGVKMGLKTTK